MGPQIVGGEAHNVLVPDDELLFTANDLPSALRGQMQAATVAIEKWDPDQLLATAEADVFEYLMSEHSVACPVLHRDQIHQLPVSEEAEVMEGWNGRTVERRRTKVVIAVPFEGEEDVFKFRASQYTLNPPRARVRPGELLVTWIGDFAGGGDAASIRRYFDEQLNKIEEHLSWSRADIERHNAELRSAVSSSLAQRRAKLLADRNLEAGLGFPVRQRPDAAKFSAPVARRKVTASKRPVANGPFRPEPVLPDAQYEQALAVLRNARNALERSPSMTTHLNEEKIRDLLLVLLNAQFEGAAAGEVFNASGKTDILIRVEDRNIFIAECKIWKGPKTIQDALTQLLGYLVWRDTKAALLLFIRSGEPSAIIDKAVAGIREHPNFKRASSTSEAGERYDFVVHANGDPNQEIRLAFMPFALRDTTGRA